MPHTPLRIHRLETAIGFALPRDYRAFLDSHAEGSGQPLRVVSTNPDYWDVRNIFEIGEAADHLQADRCYALVGDVIPTGMFPVAEDSAGNLYLVDCRSGPGLGTIYWWDHEQGLGEDRIARVADSFDDFVAALAPDQEP